MISSPDAPPVQRSSRTPSTAAIQLGIVCPMANERDTAVPFITAVLEQCRAFDFRAVRMFIVLDRICTDGTRALLEEFAQTEPQLTVVWAPENRGVVDAYVRGYREALGAGSDWILEIDAGFSHQPGDLPAFFAKMAEGYACVFGSRFCAGGQMTETALQRKIFSRGGTLLANFLLGTELEDMTSGFELFRRDALEQILQRGIRSRGHFFQTEIKAYCRHLAIAEVPIHYRAASDSVTSGVVHDAFRNLWRLFRLRLAGQL